MTMLREPLLTDRLILRDVTEADAELLFELDSDPEVMRYIGARPADEVESYRSRIQSVYVPLQSHAWHGVWIVEDRNSGEFLGWVFIRPAIHSQCAEPLGWRNPEELEVGYRYRQSAWGRGIATEAARPLVDFAIADDATTAIVACTKASHRRSQRVLEKLGLRRVGEVNLPEFDEPVVKMSMTKSAR